jgi:hypothetical protein
MQYYIYNSTYNNQVDGHQAERACPETFKWYGWVKYGSFTKYKISADFHSTIINQVDALSEWRSVNIQILKVHVIFSWICNMWPLKCGSFHWFLDFLKSVEIFYWR